MDSGVFLAIGGIGLAFLFLSLLIGDLLDFDADFSGVDADGAGWFSTKLLAAGLVGFGAFGYVASSYDAPGGLEWLIAVAGFFSVGALAYFLLLKPLAKQQSNSQLTRQSYRGLTGKVYLSIPVNGTGQVTFLDANGARVVQPAVTHDGQPLSNGVSVIIIDVAQNGVVVSASPPELEE